MSAFLMVILVGAFQLLVIGEVPEGVTERTSIYRDARGVLHVSGRGSIEDKIRGYDVGADDYLVKPFDPLELVARVHAVLRRFTAQRPMRRASEWRDDAIREWLENTYPAIARKARAQGGEIHRADETGLSNQANYGRSFAPKGQTRSSGDRPGASRSQ